MDATAFWEERNRQKNEEQYQLTLDRTRTGEGLAAAQIGRETFALQGLARGGLAQDRRPYLVGEKGPELMVPDQSGTIIPNHKLQILAKAATRHTAAGRHEALKEAMLKRAVPRAEGGDMQAGGAPAPTLRPYQREAEAAVAAGPQGVAAYHARTNEISPGSAPAPAPTYQPPAESAPNLRQAAASAPDIRTQTLPFQPGNNQRTSQYDAAQIPVYGQAAPRPPGQYGTDYGDTGLRGHPQEAQINTYEAQNGWRPGVARQQNNSAIGYDPIPDAEATDGPHAKSRFFKDSQGTIWDKGYVNVDTTKQDAFHEYPESSSESGLAGAYPPVRLSPGQYGLQEARRRNRTYLRDKETGFVPREKGGKMVAGGAPADDDTRHPSGVWIPGTGFRSTGGIRAATGREAGIAAEAATLGSPQSYGGGQRVVQPELREDQLSTGAGGFDPSKPSFSNPVGVMRGTKTTYTGPDGFGQELPTLAQASQAFIRGQGGENAPGYVPGAIPGYDPAKGPEIRATGEAQTDVERMKGEQDRLTLAATAKRPDWVEVAALANQTRAQALYDQKLMADHGEAVTDEKTGVTKYVLPAYIKQAALAHAPRTVAEVDAAMEKMKPAVETAKTINMFTDPAKSDPARASILKQYRNERAAAGQPVDPSVEKYITTAPVGTHNLEWFKGAYQRAIPKPAAAPAAPPRLTYPPVATPESEQLPEPIYDIKPAFRSMVTPPMTKPSKSLADLYRSME